VVTGGTVAVEVAAAVVMGGVKATCVVLVNSPPIGGKQRQSLRSCTAWGWKFKRRERSIGKGL
jgi:thioesterase domain-containing protein